MTVQRGKDSAKESGIPALTEDANARCLVSVVHTYLK